MKGNVAIIGDRQSNGTVQSGERALKLLKTITLEEDVEKVIVEFDKPLDEIAILLNCGFAIEETKTIAVRTDGGGWYMCWAGGLAVKNAKRYFYAHAKEFGERKWECVFSGLMEGLQGISNSTSTPKLAVSRRYESVSRYVNTMEILIANNTTNNAFSAGGTIEIWGREADE